MREALKRVKQETINRIKDLPQILGFRLRHRQVCLQKSRNLLVITSYRILWGEERLVGYIERSIRKQGNM